MYKIIIPAAVAALLTAFTPHSAVAATKACVSGAGGTACQGIKSLQTRPLELAISGTVSGAHAGTGIVATTPSLTRKQDWTVHFDRPQWDPAGVPSLLCLTATGDSVGDQVKLQTCSAADDHQAWKLVDVLHNGYSVFQNVANRLVMAAPADDVSGGAVTLRRMGTGTAKNKNWKYQFTAP